MKTSTKRALREIADKAHGLAREMNEFADNPRRAAARQPQVQAAAPKPVKLQMNTSGAWRNVISFDAANESDCAAVLDSAEQLARIAKATCRVVIDDGNPSPTMLMHWSPEKGWADR